MDVGLEFRHSFIIVCVEHVDQTLPDIKDTEDVTQNGRNMKHEKRCDQPQGNHHCDFGRVFAVAGGRDATH